MAKISEYLKTIFFIFLILHFAPLVFKNIKNHLLNNLEPKNKVGVIPFDRPIYTASPYIKQLKNYFKDPEIRAILLQVESGGGAAGSCQAIAQEILSLKIEHPKPVVAYTENICASGAYEIASTADYIIATGSSIIGNIGAKLPTQFKVKGFLQDYKIETKTISSGAYKDVFDPFTDLTQEQQDLLQKMALNAYDQFTAEVAKNRHISLQQKSAWADGKIFTGQEAKEQKLVDELGNQSTALRYISKQILHSDREIELVKQPQPSLMQQWFKKYDDEEELQYSIHNSSYEAWNRLFKNIFFLLSYR